VIVESIGDPNLAYPSGALGLYPYDYSDIQYLGRKTDTGTGMNIVWSGTQIVFKVTGTTQLLVYVTALDTNTTDDTRLVYCIDNNPAPRSSVYSTITTDTANTARNYTCLIPIPDTGLHTVNLMAYGPFAGMWAQSCKITITGFAVDYGGMILPWAQGALRLQVLGDSWVGSSQDWPRLMLDGKWEINAIGYAGFTLANENSYYNYDYSGHTNTTDLTADLVVVSFGVNDFIAGVSHASFQASLVSLISKIRAKQPSPPIVLMRIPKNIGTGDDFGTYGADMSTVAAATSNCTYLDTTSLDASVTWQNAYHLGAVGKQLFADFLDAYAITLGF
jgi:GDSL-like Lipase/Acylhydrolase family